MMSPFHLSKKAFTKNHFLMGSFVLTVLGLFAYILFWQVKVYAGGMAGGNFAYTCTLLIGHALRVSPIYFVVFAFLTYEYCTKVKSSHLMECLQAGKNSMSRLVAAQLRFLSALNGLFTLVLTAEYLIYFCVVTGWDPAVSIHGALNFFLNYFLLGLTGIFIGAACALYLKRLIAYLVLVLFVFLATPLLENIVYQVSSVQHLSLFWLHDFFNIFPPAANWDVDGLLGYSLLPYRFALLGFWGILGAVLVQFKFLSRHKKRRALGIAASAVLCAACLMVYLLPASWSVTSSDIDKRSYQADTMYYENRPEEVSAQRNEPADFKVTHYQLDFQIFLQLKATAVMTVDQGSLPVYPFTLYHCYQVSHVSDQDGAPLDYTQKGDYLEIRSGEGKSVSKIRVEYSGWSPSFYANVQAAVLPGYCVYFPRAGYQTIYESGRTFSNGIHEMGHFVPQALPEVSDFQVTVHALKKFYCNLPETKKNHFSGTSNGLTLLSGMVREMKMDGVRVVYPYLGVDYSSKEGTAAVKNALRSGYIPKTSQTIFINGRKGGAGFDYMDYSDYTVIPEVPPAPQLKPGQPKVLGILECDALRKKLPEEKIPLMNAYVAYIYSDLFPSVLKAETSGNTDEQTTYLIELYDRERYFSRFYQKCRIHSDEVVLRKVMDYLVDENDSRTPEEFLSSLPDTNTENRQYPETMSFAALNQNRKETQNNQNMPARRQGE